MRFLTTFLALTFLTLLVACSGDAGSKSPDASNEAAPAADSAQAESPDNGDAETEAATEPKGAMEGESNPASDDSHAMDSGAAAGAEGTDSSAKEETAGGGESQPDSE